MPLFIEDIHEDDAWYYRKDELIGLEVEVFYVQELKHLSGFVSCIDNKGHVFYAVKLREEKTEEKT